MIGISLLTLDRGTVGGTQTFARELVRALARSGELEYRLLVPRGAAEASGELPAAVVRAFPAHRTRAGRLAAMALAAAAPGLVRRAFGRAGLDAVHFPLGVMIPRPDGLPAATTVHDLQHEAFPEFFSRAQLAYRRRAYGSSARASRIVIAPSEHARAFVGERLGLAPERLRAIHLGVDHDRFCPDGRPREPFLFYPANAWPHKNHPRLFEAFALVRRERPDLRLVLTGAGHDRLALPDGAASSGTVGVEDIVSLYRSAAAVVFPSLYEGFGLPPLEAMACGCPVAVSDAASLPEICGEAATYFDPASVESIAQGIRDVLDRPAAGGIEQAARFTWEACARRHDAVYRELRSG